MIEDQFTTPGREPTRSLADLSVPRRPENIPYKGGEDYDAQALLVANGYTVTAPSLIELLDSDLGILQAAAARVLGAQNERAAINALQRLMQNATAEETSRVQAAFALARMDVADAKEMLIRLLEFPPEASPAPLQAAGALANLGDPRGFEVVRAALDSPNRVIAMIACKQLFNFAALDSSHVDVFEAFSRALTRPEPNISGEARAQLEELNTEKARATLAAYPPQNR